MTILGSYDSTASDCIIVHPYPEILNKSTRGTRILIFNNYCATSELTSGPRGKVGAKTYGMVSGAKFLFCILFLKFFTYCPFLGTSVLGWEATDSLT